MDAVAEAFRIIAEGVAPDGFKLADERESLLWGFVNTFDAQVRRLDRGVDRLAPELRDLQSAQDGTEVKSRELELVTDRAQNLGDRRDTFEKMRDAAADAYRVETGDTWRPRRGSNVSQTGKLTSAAIDARDFMRARKDRESRSAHRGPRRSGGVARFLFGRTRRRHRAARRSPPAPSRVVATSRPPARAPSARAPASRQRCCHW